MKMFVVSDVVREEVVNRPFATLMQALIVFGKLVERREAMTEQNLSLDLNGGHLEHEGEFIVAFDMGGDALRDAKVWIHVVHDDGSPLSKSVLKRLAHQQREV